MGKQKRSEGNEALLVPSRESRPLEQASDGYDIDDGLVPATAFLGLPTFGRDSGKQDIPSQTHFRTFLSLPVSSCSHMANGGELRLLLKIRLSQDSIHGQPRALGSAVDLTWECLFSVLHSIATYTKSEIQNLDRIRTSGFRVPVQILQR